jgi:Fe2+ or Zn2+ uptake regulation protein
VIGGGQASALEAETGVAIAKHQVIFEGLCPACSGARR